jgi:putative amide transporter protein
MVPAVLVLYGAVLFVNAFFLLGRAEPKAAGPVNAIVGLIGVVVGLYTVAANLLGPASGFVGALVMVFGITFLIVAAMVFGALDGRAVGWYCVFGAIVCLFWAWGFFTNYRSVANGTFSVIWAIVFALFAANLAFARPWARVTGYAAIFTAFATLMLPGYWLLMGGSLP